MYPDEVTFALNRYSTLLLAALLAVLFTGLLTASAPAQESRVDEGASHALTKYLHRHRLPLVGAQVFSSAGPERKLLLYGYVATDFGKHDAERKAVKFLGGGTVAITNSIEVNPSIAKQAAASRGESSRDSVPDTDAEWNKVMMGIYRNGLQPLPPPDASPAP